MPIVEPEIIKAGEKELLSSILASFDEYQIEKLFQESHSLILKEKMQFKRGKILVFNNQIAYQFDYSSVAAFPVLMNEMGKFMGFANPNDFHNFGAEETEPYDTILDPGIINVRKAEFIDSLSASIDLETITELFKKIYKLKAIGKVIYSIGDIRVLSGHVIYQFVYDIEVFFSILIDREGNYISSLIKNNGSPIAAKGYSEKTETQLEA